MSESFAVASDPDRSGSAAGLGLRCAAGGTMNESCETGQDFSRLTVTFAECRTAASDLVALVRDGQVVRAVDDPQYCTTRVIRGGATVSEEATGFRQSVELRRTETAPFETAIEVTADFSRGLRSVGAGVCGGQTGTETLDGQLSLRCAAGLGSSVCPPEGEDLALTARALTIVRAENGELTACARSRTLLGRLETRDRVSGQAFDAVYRQFLIRDQARGTQATVQLQGSLALDCLGEIAINSEIAIVVPTDARCPSSGLLFTRLPDGIERSVRYVEGAVEIDLDGDGKADEQARSCEDTSLTQCE